ncbi:hypothetical protein M2360_002942 [Rhizobium sp. SG_E_25_P2]|uniref:hypothetical protein n=1 Tax=Rhizobium sp. SG_E_25_P2 TaxID=2879942 RepID=UPI002475EFFE|nr:hypothetical protein [Rhizobium sp. SG_E_25_P2]MDH6267545.1 hypothetical protein [Rhizobium sp. SG_E_25_P2]
MEGATAGRDLPGGGRQYQGGPLSRKAFIGFRLQTLIPYLTTMRSTVERPCGRSKQIIDFHRFL